VIKDNIGLLQLRNGKSLSDDGIELRTSALVAKKLREAIHDAGNASTVDRRVRGDDRIVKFAADGKLIATWGKHGKGPGEFDQPHGIALDSAGRVYVADRANNRIQIFTPDGNFIAEWKQFGRPSDVAIGKEDMIYVADSQSDEKTNPGFKQGIRVGSIKDGTVAAFIPATSPETGSPEGVGVDDAGNVYGGWVAKRAVRRFVK
jgi:DNA-binding beta-propeller fold protein YncE